MCGSVPALVEKGQNAGERERERETAGGVHPVRKSKVEHFSFLQLAISWLSFFSSYYSSLSNHNWILQPEIKRTMNKKATVTKELNGKHQKILEGLLKLPENRECADCKRIAPRWASVNLGIFICMQCSGIHRSLGVHISKVRSTTLDTWLPDQVAFLQSMGNKESNAYWEAKLSQNYDRVAIENFIRAKYVEKRWVPKDGKVKSPTRTKENVAAAHRLGSGSRDWHGDSNKNQHPSQELKEHRPRLTNNKEMVLASKSPSTNNSIISQKTIPEPPKVSEQATPDWRGDGVMRSPEPATPNTATAVPTPKLDYATELFKLLFVGDSTAHCKTYFADSNAWVDFDVSTTEEKIASNSFERNVQLISKVEGISKDSSSMVHVSRELQKDVKNQHPALPKKEQTTSNAAPMISVHHQRLAMLAQDESLLAGAAAISSGAAPMHPFIMHEPHANGIHRESPPTQMPLTKMPNIRPATLAVSTVASKTSSISRPATPINGGVN
ncbi:hypothetical protein Ancab_005298 [Ancistrocladus abbreviatus]